MAIRCGLRPPEDDDLAVSVSRPKLYQVVIAAAAAAATAGMHMDATSASTVKPPPAHLVTAARDAELRKSIDDALAVEFAEIAHRQANIRALYTRRNTAAAISRLPNELLRLVFTLLRDGTPEPGAPWKAIAGVCTAWRALALDSPSLWSRIDVAPGPSGSEVRAQTWTDLLLKRSKCAPLDLHITLSLPQYWELPPNEAHAGGLPALEAAPRARHLVLTLPGHLPMPHKAWAVDVLAREPARFLKSLVVDSMSIHGLPSVVMLPSDMCVGARAPLLQDLQLRNCLLPPNIPDLCSPLTSLHLSFHHETPSHLRHPPGQFASFMSSLPHLRDLTLAFALAYLPDGMEVHIPNLRYVSPVSSYKPSSPIATDHFASWTSSHSSPPSLPISGPNLPCSRG
jgi:hypothetical protein